jgi:hypothetical protein
MLVGLRWQKLLLPAQVAALMSRPASGQLKRRGLRSRQGWLEGLQKGLPTILLANVPAATSNSLIENVQLILD